ncbi:hypothetical protein F5884DRAFT_672947 [Xylogone sp. PMI_703]|nr:hypothetical protein F5884DRAFT_672947 [Xylogone sp. PMI_703]
MGDASQGTPKAVLPAPPGYHVDFEHPQQYGNTQGYWVSGIGITIASFFLFVRIYTRAVILRTFALEDADLWQTKSIGVHAWEMPFNRYNYFSLLTMVSSVNYVPTLGLAKISLLLLYRRLSPQVWFNRCVYFLMAFIACYSIGIVFALIFPCHPIAANWDITITNGKCIDKATIYLFTAGVNVATDILILLLPMPMVAILHMPSIQKIGLVLLFTVGSATFITSVVRLVFMIPMLSNVDQTWAVSIPFVWINVEANLIIICCCLPVLPNLLRHLAPKLMGESVGTGKNIRSKYNVPRTTTGKFSGNSNGRSGYGLMSEGDNNVELVTTAAYANEAGEGSHIIGRDDDHDGASEKAIWQSKTVIIREERI